MGLKFFAISDSGERISLNDPIRVSLRLSTDSIAEELSLDFLSPDFNIESLVSMETELNGKLLLSPAVTKTDVFSNGRGCSARITGYNIARIMQKSEAIPQVYQNPVPEIIWDRHARPYGSVGFQSPSDSPYGQFTVYKGMSDWEAVRQFYRNYQNSEPRIDANRILTAAFLPSGITRELDEKWLLGYSVSIDREKPISEVRMRIMNGGYDYSVQNGSLHQSAPFRRKCLNYQQEVPFYTDTANTILQESLRDTASISLVSQVFIGEIGDTVSPVSFIDGILKKPIITNARYTFNGTDGGIWNTTLSEDLSGGTL